MWATMYHFLFIQIHLNSQVTAGTQEHAHSNQRSPDKAEEAEL